MSRLLLHAFFLLALLALSTIARTDNLPVNKAMEELSGVWICKNNYSTSLDKDSVISFEFEWTETLNADGSMEIVGIGKLKIDNLNEEPEQGLIELTGTGEWFATDYELSQNFNDVSVVALDDNKLSKDLAASADEDVEGRMLQNTLAGYVLYDNVWIRKGKKPNVECHRKND